MDSACKLTHDLIISNKNSYIFMYNKIMKFEEIIEMYKTFPEVTAIAVGGSGANKTSDVLSDIDVYVFVEKEISVKAREEFVMRCSSKYEVGGEYFGSGDEFWVDDLNQQLDVMYWNKNWFNEVIENTWIKYYPSNGYSTAFLFTLNNFQIMYDKKGWLTNLQKNIKTEYPQKLKDNIIKRNMMLMKGKPFASYYEQIEKAIKRNDRVSLNHRVAAFLASYFDVIFAINEMLHPGEKRLVQYAKNNCKILPSDFEVNIEYLLASEPQETLSIIATIYENLKNIL